jgi:hypothetical protein
MFRLTKYKNGCAAMCKVRIVDPLNVSERFHSPDHRPLI